MKKTSLILVMSIILFGCNSDDIKGTIDNVNNVIDNAGNAIDSLNDITSDHNDDIAELDTHSLTNTQKQNYAQISTDVNTLVLSVAGMCVDKQDAINPDFTTLSCNIADHLTDLAITEFSNIVLLNGKLDITRQNENLFIINTNEDVTFKAPIISSNTISYQLQGDNKISVQVSNENDPSLTTSFSGFYTDGSQSDNSSWTIESINNQYFSFTDDDNTQLIALTNGQAQLISKDNQTYGWSTNTTGKVILK
ncbi:hypothetical protein [Photobacterium phosphoreum]|uniref:hypothetical protein n=1 Tax=Photobacterium phosphoreum TaxID=659 RepID=UPI000D17498D|nr:hypothetical protein [Photobacterium phosphoreum]PTB32801.1 hypothetical protein DAT36_09600 [Photobacterium phosphoreum]